jgi:hypothetical protein
MFAAGAKVIVRYGSNDRGVGMDNLRDIIVVDIVNIVIGITADAGTAHREDGTTFIRASARLVDGLEKRSRKLGCPVKRMICHNVEGYHAFNFSQFFTSTDANRVRA